MRNFLVLLLMSCALTGCSLRSTATPNLTPESASAIQGAVHGGQQPIVGAHVYLFAANTTGYGNASVSLLNSLVTLHSDSVGAYVLTGPGGIFTITGDYSCTANTQVYLYALGGDPGAGANSASGLLAALGNCPATGTFLASNPFIIINEVTTVAAAYAISGFATDATHVSSSGTALAKIGIANAFANAGNLANIGGGAALATTPAGNGAAPQTSVNTLANILAGCINSAGPASAPCSTLLGDALLNGASGAQPTDTASAAINIAHNPGANVAALYGLSTANPPFPNALTAQPNDFTLSISFLGGGMTPESDPNFIGALAIDGLGNVWVSDPDNSAISELSPLGVPLSGANGYSGGGLAFPARIAIDQGNNVWIANNSPGAVSVSEFSNSGAPLTANGYTPCGTSFSPYTIAIDGGGNVLTGSVGGSDRYPLFVCKFSNSGTPAPGSPFHFGVFNPNDPSGETMNSLVVDPAPDGSSITGDVWVQDIFTNTVVTFVGSVATGISGTGTNEPFSLAVDHAGAVWVTNVANVSLRKFSAARVLLSTTPFTGGGLTFPFFDAIDGAGNVWVSNDNNVLSEFANNGTPISGSSGFVGNTSPFDSFKLIAVDGSGDVWVNGLAGAELVEVIGAAIPVVTPLSVGVSNNTLGTRP